MTKDVLLAAYTNAVFLLEPSWQLVTAVYQITIYLVLDAYLLRVCCPGRIPVTILMEAHKHIAAHHFFRQGFGWLRSSIHR